LEASLDIEATYTVISAAARVAHSIGLNKRIARLQDHGLSQAESKQRRNVFWVLYFIDKGLAIRLGRPPFLNDDDIDIQLPERGELFHGGQNGEETLDGFYYHILLSRIESKIYSELYSVRSQKLSVGDRLKVISQLDRHLQDWRDDLPLELRPGEPIKFQDSRTKPFIMLHFVYYNCMTIIHRAPAHCALWTMQPPSSDNMNRLRAEAHHRISASQMHCIDAARNTALLLSQFGLHDKLPPGVLAR
jgi:hypothetical protein